MAEGGGWISIYVLISDGAQRLARSTLSGVTTDEDKWQTDGLRLKNN